MITLKELNKNVTREYWKKLIAQDWRRTEENLTTKRAKTAKEKH